MQLNRILTVAMAAAAATSAGVGESTSTRTITLEECVQEGLQHNLALQIERLNPDIAQVSLSGAYAGYDPTFSLSSRRTDATQPGGYDEQGRRYLGTQMTTDSFSSGLGGLLPTGLNYQLGGSINQTFGFQSVNLPGGNSVTRTPFENTSAQIGIQLTQPILRNFTIDATRMNILLRKQDLRTSELQYRYVIMQTVESIQEAYYALVASREQIKVSRKALDLSEQLLRESKKRVEVGVMAPLDEKSAESEVAANRAALLGAENNYVVNENQLKGLLTDQYSDWQGLKLQPVEGLTAIPQVPQRSDSWQKGLTLRPDLLQLRVEMQRKDIRLKYNKSQLYPQLDLVGSYGQSGSGREYSSALGDIVASQSPSYSFGATFSVPLSNRGARTNYRLTKQDIEQGLLRLKQQEQQIMVQIDNAIAQVKSSYEQVDATKKAREYAEAALDAEQKKLDNGKSTSYQVLQYQRDLTSRRYQEIAAVTQYNIALARLALNEGTTLEKNNITVTTK